VINLKAAKWNQYLSTGHGDSDFQLSVIIMSIKAFTISPVYEVSLFGKIIRVAVLRGFIWVSLIFNKFYMSAGSCHDCGLTVYIQFPTDETSRTNI